MATSKTQPGFRHVTAAAIRRLVRHNRGAFLPSQILVVLDEQADNDGRCFLTRTDLSRVVGSDLPPITSAIRVLSELGLISIENTRPNPWRIVIVHVADKDEPLLAPASKPPPATESWKRPS